MAEMETPRTPELTEQEQIRRQKLQALMAAGQNPYTITCFDVTHRSEEITAQYDQLEGKTVSIAGRMTSRRIPALMISRRQSPPDGYSVLCIMEGRSNTIS